MTNCLRQFMNGIIDYAGLFPPAKLPLDEAINNYSKYRNGKNAWMLSRFIVPASKLPQVSKYDDLFSKKAPFHFSVLGKATETIGEFEREVDEVLTYCGEFCQAHPEEVTTQMVEIKLPAEAAFSQDVNLLKNLMDDMAVKLSQSTLTPFRVFYESLQSKNWQKDIQAIIEAISTHNKSKNFRNENYQSSAFKIRCGGVKAELFPSIEQVAFVLNSARRNSVALKGTAGLHHPVRHYADEVQTKMHGFFNVFGGAMLAHANGFDDAKLQEVLNEEDAGNFSFTDETFSWKDYSISTRQIKTLREQALLSYGSCSFNEPREDLQKLKLL